jgi:hypothetical protein
MVVSADTEPSLGDVVTNLATVCAETGQQVALLSTAGLGSPEGEPALTSSNALWWKNWPTPGNGAGYAAEEGRDRLMSGPVDPADVEQLFGETGIAGVRRLDLRYFVAHSGQVVVRVPEVVEALLQLVDVVLLEVPSYLSVHHGEGLTPLADAVLVVAEREMTTITEMRRLKEVLLHLEAPVVGMAMTDGTLEAYDWGLAEEELETSATQQDHHALDVKRTHPLDPTEQIPVSRSTGISADAPLEDISVAEHSQQEA